jgi:hypothetical protein
MNNPELTEESFTFTQDGGAVYLNLKLKKQKVLRLIEQLAKSASEENEQELIEVTLFGQLEKISDD